MKAMIVKLKWIDGVDASITLAEPSRANQRRIDCSIVVQETMNGHNSFNI